MEIRDQLNRKIELKNTPERIVSLVPSQTELLVDLGLENNIVGITHFCVHPPHLKESTISVGGTKKVNFRKVKELRPDIILCNKEENTREMVQELEKIAPVHISNVASLEDVYTLIRDYGQILDCSPLAQTLISAIGRKAEALNKLAQKSAERRVAYFIWDQPLMVAGNHTFINEMLKINKFRNVFSEPRYPETNLQEINDREVDICMLSSEPFPFKEQHKAKFEKVSNKTLIVNGEYFSWYGSRLLEAMDYFRQFHS